MLVLMIGVSTYHVTRELPAPMQEELSSVEDLQEVVDKLRSEMESCRKKCPMRNKVLRINGKRGFVIARFLT
jgi:hypothetical protein